MVISLPDHAEDLQREKAADLELVLDTRSRSHYEDIGIGIKGSKREKNTNKGLLNLKVAVDVREFRSSLPSLLHSTGFEIIPRTLQVGDYVLSAETCVERKGISDLFQSFASGRLYNQAESMSKHYLHPCLLIEFHPQKSFNLQISTDIGPDIQTNNITTRICLLVLSFPNLKMLWSRHAAATTDIFKSIMVGHDEVDLSKAVSAGMESNASNLEGNDENDRDLRATAQEMLLSLPGINTNNFRAVMNEVESIASLSAMSEKDLSPLIGPGNAKKLFHFFHRRTY
jgi:DNA excision repair protein ERCC-4